MLEAHLCYLVPLKPDPELSFLAFPRITKHLSQKTALVHRSSPVVNHTKDKMGYFQNFLKAIVYPWCIMVIKIMWIFHHWVSQSECYLLASKICRCFVFILHVLRFRTLKHKPRSRRLNYVKLHQMGSRASQAKVVFLRNPGLFSLCHSGGWPSCSVFFYYQTSFQVHSFPLLLCFPPPWESSCWEIFVLNNCKV